MAKSRYYKNNPDAYDYDSRISIDMGQAGIGQIDFMLEEVHKKIENYEESIEEILTMALNVEEANEIIDKEIEGLTKLIDNLREYDKKLNTVGKQAKELCDLLCL